MRDGDEYSAVSWGVRRYLVEGTNAEAIQNSSLILAAGRTHRRDLLDNFRYYKGGWNIREKHYLSSAGITGVPLFLIAAIWFLGFGLCLIIIGLNYCCCYPRFHSDSPTAYAFSLNFLTLFTVAAITGCIVLYIGQGKFHHQTTTTLEHVLKKADTVVENLKNVSNSLAAAKQVGVDQIFLPADVQNNIDKVQRMINNSSITLENETKKNSKSIPHVFDSVRLSLIIIATVMLLLSLLGFLFSVFSLKFLVYTMMADTCVAMDQWLQNPTAHTALDEILPCLDNATTEETLYESKDVTFQLVANVNQFITNVPNSPINELNYNQSGPMVPIVCNPFHSDMTDRKSCANGEVGLNNAAQEWKKYVCQVSKTGNCTSVGRLTPSFYNQMVAIVDVSSAVHNYRPFLVDIQDCTFVRKTFSDISDDHCPGLRHYSKLICVGLAMVSAAVMLSLILWVFNARERQHRVYKQFITSPPMSL